MPLTPADVRNKQFSTTRLRPGYDEEEVDAFLDEVEAELDRLIQENEELRSKLTESLRGAGKATVPASPSPLHEPPPEMMAPQWAGQMLGAPPAPPQEQERPAGTGGMPGMGQNVDSIARMLSIAQQTADQAVADARREASETLGQARREAGDILSKARRQAEQIASDARARSESLDRDAQERHRQALGSLIKQREELERKVDDLRTFERECRTRLTAYLQSQLRTLDVDTAGSGTFPPMITAPHTGTFGVRPAEPEPRRS